MRFRLDDRWLLLTHVPRDASMDECGAILAFFSRERSGGTGRSTPSSTRHVERNGTAIASGEVQTRPKSGR